MLQSKDEPTTVSILVVVQLVIIIAAKSSSINKQVCNYSNDCMCEHDSNNVSTMMLYHKYHFTIYMQSKLGVCEVKKIQELITKDMTTT